MGRKTLISWADRTYNHWIGCTKVGPGCDFCYAEAWDNRFNNGEHWGPGAPRRLTKTHRQPYLWNQEADSFEAKFGHPIRVFAQSLSDWADKEVPDEWRDGLWQSIKDNHRLRWMLCTKRVTNIGKMIPKAWDPELYDHVGFLITCVNQEEANRDVPRLLYLKKKYGFRWVGVSYEPALGQIYWDEKWLGIGGLNWIIYGGESDQGGNKGRPDNPDWARLTRNLCRYSGTAYFTKQMARLAPIPEDLMIREFPGALC